MSTRLYSITTFGLGHLRPAPGTWGSLPPIALAALLYLLGHGPGTAPILFSLAFAVILLAFSLACILQGDAAEAKWGKDPSNVVADETAGQCVPLLFLPAAAFADWPLALFTLVLAFLAFRIMDILKPWPAFRLQELPGGWGILVDDLVAGLYAAVIVQVCSRVALA